MYELNRQLVERYNDRAYFSPATFKVLRLNPAAHDVLKTLRKGPFSHSDFLAASSEAGVSSHAGQAFWNKCLDHQLIVEVASNQR